MATEDGVPGEVGPDMVPEKAGDKGEVIKTAFQVRIESAGSLGELYEIITETLAKRGKDGKHLIGDIQQALSFEKSPTGVASKSSAAALEDLRNQDLVNTAGDYMNEYEVAALIKKVGELKESEPRALAEAEDLKKVEIAERKRARVKEEGELAELENQLKIQGGEENRERLGKEWEELAPNKQEKPLEKKGPWWRRWLGL